MPGISVKKINEIKNKSKTRKKREDKKCINKSTSNLTPQQITELCKNSSKTYEPFEYKIEELFKKKKLTIFPPGFILENQLFPV